MKTEMSSLGAQDSSRATAPGQPASSTPAETRRRILETLKSIYDPEIPVDIYELGLIYDLNLAEDGTLTVSMTLTTPMCPVAESLPYEVEAKLRRVPGVSRVQVDLVWDPPWNLDFMSEAARLELNL